MIAAAICLTVTTMFSGCKDDGIDSPQKAIITGAQFNECPETTVILTASTVDNNSMRSSSVCHFHLYG